MKKSTILLNIIIIFTLTSCENKNLENVNNLNNNTPIEENVNKSELENEDIEFSDEEFILNTFSENGLNTDISNINIKHEDEKTVGIYKEIVPNNKPNISKIVFITKDNKRDIVFLMVNNKKIN